MPEIVLELPKLHPKQRQVWQSTANDILFAGDTRAGKSYFIRYAYIKWCATIPGLVTDIFRLFYDDVISENMIGETSFPILLHKWEQAKLVKITESQVTFWNDSVISLHHCSDDNAMLKHRGNACHVRTFAESTQILEHRIRALTGWVTMSDKMKARVPPQWAGQFPKVFHVTNPKGISSGYYRRNYVDAQPPLKMWSVGGRVRQYIPAFLDDNPSEDAEQTKARIKEAFTDEATQKSFINEDKTGITNWHQISGDFFPEWNPDRHVIADLNDSVPHSWFRFRVMDLGYAEPFAVYWIAVSDGEPFRDRDNNERWFPRGAFIVYNEWYGCQANDPSKGIRMRNEDIASGILERSEIQHQNVTTLTDSLPFQDRGGEGPQVTFKRCGVPLTLGDTSRVVGWSAVRGRLIGQDFGGETKIPMLYITENCSYLRSYLPALQRHPSESKREDAQEHGEATHAPDALRLGCMAHTIIKDNPSLITNALIKRTIQGHKPTINKILRSNGGFAL